MASFSFKLGSAHCRTHALQNQSPRTGHGLVKTTLDLIEGTADMQTLIHEIRERRRGGRPGYPPEAMLRAFLLKFILNERFNVGLIQRLRDSAKLREICGFDSEIPSESALSRGERHYAATIRAAGRKSRTLAICYARSSAGTERRCGCLN